MMDFPSSSTTDQLSVSLKAWPPQNTNTQALPYLIARINEQRGSFRSLTEAGLEEEIRAAEAGEQKESSDEEDVEDGQDAETKGKELSEAREEIIKQVGEAYNTSAQALDLVSLLLSRHTPKAAEATVSPYVKQAIPFGSLGAEMMQTNPPPQAETDSLVGLGWRMDSLSRSAESLLTSAKRLEQEMKRETSYWRQVLAIKEAGWPICRIPGERQTLGVRFGFTEAHTDFRDRGLAALRRDADGPLQLDRGQRWQGDKRLRVRFLSDGHVSAVDEPPTPSIDDQSVSRQLLRARSSLFDEEVYHELNREARNLVNQEVRCIEGTIRFPYDGSEIEISLIDMDEHENVEKPRDPIPTAIATTLRILLSHAHRQNLQRRSQPPPPITETPAPRPFYSLLRPILEVIQHQSHWKATKAYIADLSTVLDTKGLTCSVQKSSSSLDLSGEEEGRSSLVNRLVRPHRSSITLRLPSTAVDIEIHTSIFPPTFGTSFQLTTADAASAETPQVMSFTTLDRLRKHVWYRVLGYR